MQRPPPRLGPALGRALPYEPRPSRPPEGPTPSELRPSRPPERPTPYGVTRIPDPTDPVPAPWAYGPPSPPASPEPRAPSPAAQPSAALDWLELPEERDPWRAPGRSPPPRPRGSPQPQRPRRLGRSVYDAEESLGHFGLVDTGEVAGGVRSLVAHVPRRSRGYQLDLRPGDVVHANSARGTHAVGGRLSVVYVTRHKYFAPGRAVTSCVLGVPDHQWLAAFAT
jgi:hypothetical protein